MKKTVFVLVMMLMATGIFAQHTGYSKMSPLVRRAAIHDKTMKRMPQKAHSEKSITAFVRVKSGSGNLLVENGCKVLAQFGDIYIASIPLGCINALSDMDAIERIEARESCSLLMDTTGIIIGANKLYVGEGLPQAFTGKGVVLGLQDVGFDLTNPNFYDTSMSDYRIKRFWDQLSADTIGSNMYVGAEYVTRDEILSYAHSRDGLIQCHGNHTLGIAAGTGYDTPYRGIAYESDICLVNNAVTSDTVFIDEDDLYKYTSATDALGFKYIFDYAASVGKPCVISFSEGSHQDFSGDDMLFYEVLENMVGEGRIIVASAGNEGYIKTYFRKERGVESAGTFLLSSRKYAFLQMKSDAPFHIKFNVYDGLGNSEEICVYTDDIFSSPDSLYTDTLSILGKEYVLMMAGYPSCYDERQNAYEVYLETTGNLGREYAVSMEIIGEYADVEVYRSVGDFVTNASNPMLNAGEYSHSIYSPGSAPAVICVGATVHRVGTYRQDGQYISVTAWGSNGEYAGYSSVGPTFDDRIKPEVVAPGTNIVSSLSSYYMEANPSHSADFRVTTSEYNGRVYPWNMDCGTSMSTPVVSGAIALWLQAVPKLTPNDIVEVFKRTCNCHDKTLEYPNNYYGYGEIDVYRGLLDILGLSSIKEITAERPKALNIRLDGCGELMLDSSLPIQNPFTVSVYTASGMLVMKRDFQPQAICYSINLSSLPQGVYAVQVSGRDKGITGSTLIRK